MGTRSIIMTEQGDKFVGVYAHWDGYPSYRIPLLLKYHNSQEAADAIVALGSISSLNPFIAPADGVEHSFDSPANNVTIAYNRDRDEDLDIETADTRDELVDHEYSYCFQDGQWWFKASTAKAVWESAHEWFDSATKGSGLTIEDYTLIWDKKDMITPKPKGFIDIQNAIRKYEEENDEGGY